VSHHVHHYYSDVPRDPYNATFGFLYCFLADANHQPINRNMSRDDYSRVTKFVDHVGHEPHTYEEYLLWGTIISPLDWWTHLISMWVFWYAAFFTLGGHSLATALFAGAGVWSFGIRLFNYGGHADGKILHVDGEDFCRDNLAINQRWPGCVAGEWHNNHHLYPKGARSGFLPHQIDLPWCYIWTMHQLGAVSSYRDFKEEFLKKHYIPYTQGVKPVPYQPPTFVKQCEN